MNIDSKFWIVRHYGAYRETIWSKLFPDIRFLNHPLYRAIIEYVLDKKAPLFFTVQNNEERMAFTTPYNIIGIPERVGKYANDTYFSLTCMHEFIHNLFSYPRHVAGLTSRDFDEQMMRCEAVASNATEVLIYYDFDDLREQTRELLPVIWFDILYERLQMKNRPSVSQLLDIRQDWLRSNAYDWLYCSEEKYKPVAQFMARWRNGNEVYWHKRLAKLRKLLELEGITTETLNPLTYEYEVRRYDNARRSLPNQSDYEALQLAHVRALYGLKDDSENAPSTFDELCERTSELDTIQVVFPE
jgi:hypothetical protein